MKVTVYEVKQLSVYSRIGKVAQTIITQPHYVEWLNNMMRLCESHGIDFVHNLSHMNETKKGVVTELWNKRNTQQRLF